MNHLRKLKHFEQEGFKRSTLYDIIKRYEIVLPVEHHSGAGHPPYFNRNKLKSLRNVAMNRVDVSQRKLARKFGVGKLLLCFLGLPILHLIAYGNR
ncbi:unnamed protein product [Rotaria sp. Silwood2]|nr:unnamed protein product [Rotaria sp. Silwood2]CAF3391974.1 unnamed protein product [Rotaria sp. Silwood2]CAF3993919.1 unnamed protein product [Rotaria sp. Silwood2]CAF4388134.1 unnamed protein product [Rotaria sp. Silwood2]CAF4390251.1 unnamed protein product [Rotaria sp. Silwood2]